MSSQRKREREERGESHKQNTKSRYEMRHLKTGISGTWDRGDSTQESCKGNSRRVSPERIERGGLQ